MISIQEMLQKIVCLTEETQSIKHLPHHGELLYTGNPQATVEHLKAMTDLFSGKRRSDHNLSYKVDGSVSVIFGKHGGRSFVKYKGDASPFLYSIDEIKKHTKDKPYLLQPFLAAFQAAQHQDIQKNVGYQADIALESGPKTFKGNLISYLKPSKGKKHAIAVHTQLNTDTGEKTASNPNVSFLETDKAHFPHLDLSQKKFSVSSEEMDEIKKHISTADTLLADKRVKAIADEISSHVDPTNKTGHRHLIFKQFTNAVQRGEVGERSLDSLQKWLSGKIEKAKGAEKQRLVGHLEFTKKDPIALHNLLQAHNSTDMARDMIVDVLHRHAEHLPMTPEGGHSEGEGFVTELKGFGQVKLVPQTFTTANVAQKEKFKKQKIKEEMTAGGGAIAGMGYNPSSGKEDPTEVAVSRAAQARYTGSNMMEPLYGNQYTPEQKRRKRQIVRNMLGRMNVGREAY